MANYWFSFGSPVAASLSPTFITFTDTAGVTRAGPTITERPPGSGLYTVNYGATVSMAFLLDGATTGLGSAARYIPGVFDPQDNMSATLTVIGASLATMGGTLNAIGTTIFGIGATVAGMGNTLSGIGSTLGGSSGIVALLGDTSSSFGSTSVDPTTVFGFLKRSQEMAEGNRTYTKATGLLDYYNRGSSTLLREKTITDATAGTTCI